MQRKTSPIKLTAYCGGNPSRIGCKRISCSCGRSSRTYCYNFSVFSKGSTKWCGTGNAAEGLDDLGTLRDLDLCCRDHDLCPEVLEPGETKHNLTNDSPFTICSNRGSSRSSWGTACQEYKLDVNGEPKYQTMDMRSLRVEPQIT
ncbi:Phospholipase A2 [Armadillidium nasatum]|uniref:Phospholipase A2 n=1 Tax=Armadillidium nasatum TaxID=96803 RepID=A0A5N5TFL4_9CRUS|nr:Phospholipase A2 [Armadillidium nasatum]